MSAAFGEFVGFSFIANEYDNLEVGESVVNSVQNRASYMTGGSQTKSSQLYERIKIRIQQN
jgi:hypothetical protein